MRRLLFIAVTTVWMALSGLPLAAADVATFKVPLDNANGTGTCSPANVTGISFTVTAPSPGLQAVLACNKAAYDALMKADLTKPDSANLPAPLLDLSCTAPNTTTCTKQMPLNRKLKSQIMCLLLKGATPAGGAQGQTVEAKVDVTWITDNSGNATASDASTVWRSSGVMTMVVAVAGWALMA